MQFQRFERRNNFAREWRAAADELFLRVVGDKEKHARASE
jgi:hypothetical protein